MTFNIRHGAESSLDEVAAAIRAEDPDVVALQEVDRDTARSGNVDQPYRLGQLTGMASSFREAYPFDGGSYGLSVLSRLPIVSSDKVVLTSADPDQPRILVVWQLQLANGESLEFANAHLGLDATERATQAEEVLSTLSGRQRVVLLGDLNEAPDGGPQEGTLYSTLTATLGDAWTQAGDGDGFTFPAGEPTSRIDYVLLGSDWQPATLAYVSKTETSDHRPIIVDVPMP